MLTIKTIHVTCAYLTGLGFVLRGLLVLYRNARLTHPLARTLPHIVDSILLLSAIAMIQQWSISIADSNWLIAKILALLIYIAFGFLMLRFGSTRGRRLIGLVGGIVAYAYIVWVAHTKNVAPWLGVAILNFP